MSVSTESTSPSGSPSRAGRGRARRHTRHLTAALAALAVSGVIALAIVLATSPVNHARPIAPAPTAGSVAAMVRPHYHGFGS